MQRLVCFNILDKYSQLNFNSSNNYRMGIKPHAALCPSCFFLKICLIYFHFSATMASIDVYW